MIDKIKEKYLGNKNVIGLHREASEQVCAYCERRYTIEINFSRDQVTLRALCDCKEPVIGLRFSNVVLWCRKCGGLLYKSIRTDYDSYFCLYCDYKFKL